MSSCAASPWARRHLKVRMTDERLPPRPPRFPPRLFKDYVWMIFVNVLALWLDLQSAHNMAQSGFTVFLFIMCVASTLAMLCIWIWALRTRKVWREWRALLRAYDEHNAAMREREQRK